MDSTTPLSNAFIRSPSLPYQQQQYHNFQHQKPSQSFCLNSIAPSLSNLQDQKVVIPEQQSFQRKQKQSLLEVPPLQYNIKHNSLVTPTTIHNATHPPNYHLSNALNEKVACFNSPPPSCEQLDLVNDRKKNHPQIWCGKGQTEPTVSKHVYNYAQRKNSSEKTPMCKVAELTRYNKLRHGYILLDESGPAHKKKFTVKLVLCPGQEFEGSGPSIKKAQQAAAQSALDSTTLPRPPPIEATRGSRQTCNAILLLNSVAAQLGIIVSYKEELIRHHLPSFKSSILSHAYLSSSPFVNILNNNELTTTIPPTLQTNGFNTANPHFPLNLCLSPSTFFTSTSFSNPVTTSNVSSQHQNILTNKNLTSILDFSVPLSNTSPTETNVSFPILPNTSAITSLPLFNHSYFSLLPSYFLPLPPSISSNGLAQVDRRSLSASDFNPFLRQQQQGFTYKVTISLSLDSTEHFGFGLHLAIAKQKAAFQALTHLKPVLEYYRKSKEYEENSDKLYQHIVATSDFNSKALTLRILGESQDVKGRLCSVDNSLSSTSGSAEDDNSNDSDFSPALNALLNQYYCGEKQTEDKVKQNAYKDKASTLAYRSFRSRRRTKSVVSQIHECALRLRMNVEFEVLAETGEPHNRVYTLRCRLISPSTVSAASAATDSVICKEYSSEGKGPSKKAAKQEACYQLLEKVRPLLDDDPIFLASQIIRNSGAVTHNQHQVLPQGIHREGKEYTKRKTIIKDKKMDPEYGHHINPVSRLIQVMQIRQEREPTFNFISEQGQNRHKEFTVSVQCMGLQEKGTGPNKKLAKRAAAEAMLARIGYVKSMPQPGKSLLKKNILSDQTMNKTLMDQSYDTFLTKTSNEQTNSFETFSSIEEELCNIEQNSPDDNIRGDKSFNKNSFGINLTTSPINEENIISHIQESSSLSPSLPSTRRRVTFNEHVSACPPPEDSDYPSASIAPLKSELSGRIRRRNRDSQRILSQTEIQELKKHVALFFQWHNVLIEKRGLVNLEKDSIWTSLDYVDKFVGRVHETFDSLLIPVSSSEQKQLFQINQSSDSLTTTPSSPPPILPINYTSLLLNNGFNIQTPNQMISTSISNCNGGDNAVTKEELFHLGSEDLHNYGLIGSKTFLNHLSKHFKFTVSYSDFPRSKNAADDEQCFTLLTIGLSKPIVCHGSGSTEVCAHTDAAFNAIQTLLKQLYGQESEKVFSTKK